MPINCYTGLMGSGKTYECVSSVIVPAIAKGRRVVSNIENLNVLAIREFAAKSNKIDIAKCGELVCVSNEQIRATNFFPDDSGNESLVKAGDIVCIDEAWQFFGSSEKLSDNAMNFFRMHRHYVHPETKVSCDIVLMVQSISDLHRSLKIVVEFTFVFTKLKALGLNSRYRVELFQGHRVVQKSRVSWQSKKYNKNIFPLYSSYAGGKGSEISIDNRTNIFTSKKLWVMVLIFVTAGSIGFITISRFFTSKSHASSETQSTSVASPQNYQVNNQVNQANEPQSTLLAGRMIGSIENEDGELVYLAEESGYLVPLSPSAVTGKGITIIGELDGKRYLNQINIKPKEEQ